MHETEHIEEKVILVGIDTGNPDQAQRSLDELAELASKELPEVPVYLCADLGQALDTALGLPQGAVVCGSLYLAAQSRPKLLERL